MTRINRNNIQLGDSFVVSIEDCGHKAKIQAALEKEQEIILHGEQRAQEIIEQANLQAQQIIVSAEQEALSKVDSITQQAHNEGFEAGRVEGLESITQELQDKIIAVNDFAQSNFDIKNNIIKSAHLDIIRLIVEIAQKVCSTSFELDDNILKEITLQAIKSLKDKEDITIIVHPEMAQKIYAISDEFKAQIPQLSSIKIVEDASVSPDGTIVESPMSRVDSRVKSQINEIADKLMAKLDSTPIEGKGEREKGNRSIEIGKDGGMAELKANSPESPTSIHLDIHASEENLGWASAHQVEKTDEDAFVAEETLTSITEEIIKPSEEEISTEEEVGWASAHQIEQNEVADSIADETVKLDVDEAVIESAAEEMPEEIDLTTVEEKIE